MAGDEYLEHLDGLRTVALLGVVMFHFEVPYFSGGFTGVDCFLVLSGFLMTRNIWRDVNKGVFAFREFYGRRFWRLYPAFLATVLAALVAAFFLYPVVLAQEVAETALAAMFLGSNVYFLMHVGYFDTAVIYKPLLHMWSLSMEEQYYLVWPLVLWLVVRRSRTARERLFKRNEAPLPVDGSAPPATDGGRADGFANKRRASELDPPDDVAADAKEPNGRAEAGGDAKASPAVMARTGPVASVDREPPVRKGPEPPPRPTSGVLITLFVLFTSSFMLSYVLAESHPDFAFYMLPTRIYEFCAGGFAAVLWRNRPRRGVVAEATSVLGLATIVLSYGLLHGEAPVSASLPLVLGTVAVVMTPDTATCRTTLGNPWMQFIGRASYSCYLTHWVLWVYWRFVKSALGSPDARPNAEVMLLLTLLSGVLLRYAVENPLRRGRRRFLVPFALAWVLTLGLALTGVMTGGWEFRVLQTENVSNTIGRAWQRELCRDAEGVPTMRTSPANRYMLSRGCLVGREDATHTKDAVAVVIGNSFTRMLTPAFDRIGKQQNLAFLFQFRAGCPFRQLSPTDREETPSPFDCLASRIAGWELLGTLRPNTRVLVASNYESSTIAEIAAMFQDIRKLRLKPILIAPPPGLEDAEHFAACYAMQEMSVASVLETLGYPLQCSKWSKPLAQSSEFMTNMTIRHAENWLNVVSLYPEMCKKGSGFKNRLCRAIYHHTDPGLDHRVHVYASDGMHLTTEGSEYLAPKLYKRLRLQWPELPIWSG